MNKRSAVASPDGILRLPKDVSIEANMEYGAPMLRGHMVVPGIQHDANRALAMILAGNRQLVIAGRSGLSRAGVQVIEDLQDGEGVRVGEKEVVVPVCIVSVRAVEVRQDGVHDDLLSVLRDMTHERDVPVGRVVLADPADALSKEEVLEAFAKHRLALPPGFDTSQCVDDDGCLVLPLDQLHFVLCEANFHTEQKRSVIRFGKHGLEDVQEERDGLPPHIGGKQFFVGSIRVSIGPYIGIIDAKTNKPNLIHLAARVLDGIRTTGLSFPRQVELFNLSHEDVLTHDLRIRIRLHHAGKDVQVFADRVINGRTIVDGVSLPDVIELSQHPERIGDLMKLVKPSRVDGDPAAYFVGPGRAHKVPWVDHASSHLQGRHATIVAPRFTAGDPDYKTHVREMPQEAAALAELLGFVGQDQSHANLFVQWGFPDTDTMRSLQQSGIGVFVAHDVREHPKTYSRERPLLNRHRKVIIGGEGGEGVREENPVNDVFLDDKLFSALQEMHAADARFLLVRHEAEDKFGESDVMPEEVFMWDKRGFWVRPAILERLEKVDTLIAMYGSHVDGMKDVLLEQITRFELRMKKLFGDHVGIIHGKGPGLMYIADYVARHLPELAKNHEGFQDIKEGILSIGVGIDLEQQNQGINHHPDAQVDFGAQHRLVRQKHMNDRMSFNVFNLGGSGTLEEIAISLCSQKLYKNLMTPLILVDPLGLSNEGGNFWLKLKNFIEDMASTKRMNREEADHGTANVQLMQEHMKNLVHVVDNYDGAADIIEKFVKDPVGYYRETGVSREEFKAAFEGAIDVRRDTHFPMPHWMDAGNFQRMVDDSRWPEAVA